MHFFKQQVFLYCNRIHSTDPVLPDEPMGPNFAPCERIRKLVRQLTDTVKRRPARPVDGYTWP